MKEIKRGYDFPSTPHFAIILFKTETVSEYTGWEKESGGPNQKEMSSFEYQVFDSEEEWKKAIEMMYLVGHSDFVAIRSPGKVGITRSVNIA